MLTVAFYLGKMLVLESTFSIITGWVQAFIDNIFKDSTSGVFQGCNIVHHTPKCMSCHKTIVVITRRAHCFHDCIYIMPVFLLWDLSTVYCGSLMTTYVIYTYIDRCYIYTNIHVLSIPQSIEMRRTFECDPC